MLNFLTERRFLIRVHKSKKALFRRELFFYCRNRCFNVRGNDVFFEYATRLCAF